MKSNKSIRRILLVVLPAILIVVGLLIVLAFRTVSPIDVQVVNVSANGATLIWRTDTDTAAEVLVEDVDGQTVGTFYDARDVEQVESGEFVLTESGRQSRSIHFVNIRGLVPDSDYRIYITGGTSRIEVGRNEINGTTFEASEIVSPGVSTLLAADEVAQPDPVYGKVLDTDQQPLSGYYVQAYLIDEYQTDGVTNYRISNLQGALTNTEGGWSMDMTSFYNSAGEQFRLTKSTEISLVTISPEGRAFSFNTGLDSYKPVDTIIFDTSYPIPDSPDIALIPKVKAGTATLINSYTVTPSVQQESGSSANYNSLPESYTPTLVQTTQCSKGCPAGYSSGNVWVDPQYGCVTCNSSMCAQIVNSSSQNVCCGKRAVNWNTQDYRDFAARVCGETTVPTGGSNTCSGGVRCDGTKIPYESTYIGMQTCGVDYQYYTCTYNGWEGTGQGCRSICEPTQAPTSAPTQTSTPVPEVVRCSGRKFCDGKTVITDTTYDGFTMCAQGGDIIECTPDGWIQTGRKCEDQCQFVEENPIPEPTGNNVSCPQVTKCGGDIVTSASTFDGLTVCDVSGSRRKCTESGWEVIGSCQLECNELTNPPIGPGQGGGTVTPEVVRCPQISVCPDDPISPESTYEGLTVCDSIGIMQECTSEGWKYAGDCSQECTELKYPDAFDYLTVTPSPTVSVSPTPPPQIIVPVPNITLPPVTVTSPPTNSSTLRIKVLPVFYSKEMDPTLNAHLTSLNSSIESKLEKAIAFNDVSLSVDFQLLAPKTYTRAPDQFAATDMGVNCEQYYDKAFTGAWEKEDWVKTGCWGSGTANYEFIVVENNICALAKQYADDPNVDGFEVWLYAFGHGGFSEGYRIGPSDTLYSINGGTKQICDHPVNLMGFNYQTGADHALHSYGHRIENTLLKRVPGNGYVGEDGYFEAYANPYDTIVNFRTTLDSPCGFVHFPPNAKKHYDYGNYINIKDHYCNTWLTTKQPESSNCGPWGCTQLGFMEYWLSRVPKGAWPIIVADYERNTALEQNVIAENNRQSVLGANNTDVIEHDDSFYRTILEPGEYRLGDVTFEITGGSRELILFNDINGDGVQQDGESRIYPIESPIRVSDIEESASYSFVAGWNPISLSLVPEDDFKASDLVNDALDQGILITHVATFLNGKWEIISNRSDDQGGQQIYGQDYNLVPGRGYFIKVEQAGEYELHGFAPKDAIPVEVQQGWNLVGFPYLPSDTSSTDIFDACEEQDLACQTLSRYESGRYESVIKENDLLFGNGFNILSQKAYFLRLSSGNRALLTVD